uniref:Deoxynucleotidyltransferase, terminal n=1 Tax=Neogobius melanostomus TaxID=47308 RepID=A0A8C6UM51_9GOBI
MLSAPGSCGRKRARPAEVTADACECKDVKFGDARLFLVERKMGRSRRSFLTKLATSKGFIVDQSLSDEITHVISEDKDAAFLWEWLKGRGLKNLPTMHVVGIGWFTESMKEGRPVAVETRHLIQMRTGPAQQSTVCPYACQRRTTTANKNKRFTDALEVLVEYHELTEIEGPRVAYSRAASVLKSLPWTIESMGGTEALPCVGEKTRTLIQVTGWYYSYIVLNISDQEYILFTSVFGVGPKTADKWYRRGLRSFSQILADPDVQLNRMQQNGFLHYTDLSRGLSAAEARAVEAVVGETVRTVAPNARVVLTGGFRRGKEFGHDVDFIVTTAEPGRENSLLPLIMGRLEEQGLLLFQAHHPSTLALKKIPCRRFEAMDYYSKCFLILKLEGSRVQGGGQAVPAGRGWRAVRVDLVAPPIERFAFTQLGWTGSKFERDLRRFARVERNMLLDNHALFDKAKNQFLAAVTEKDIFAHLGLEYMEPWQRNA